MERKAFLLANSSALVVRHAHLSQKLREAIIGDLNAGQVDIAQSLINIGLRSNAARSKEIVHLWLSVKN